MNDDIVSKENLSKEMLKEIFVSAYFDVSQDDSGDLTIKERYTTHIQVDKSNRYICFFSNILRNEKSGLQERHAYTNAVNCDLIAVRAIELEKIFSYDYYLWIEGGVTKKNIILAFKNFSHLVESAVAKDKYEVLK
jgi:hypothetical protein